MQYYYSEYGLAPTQISKKTLTQNNIIDNPPKKEKKKNHITIYLYMIESMMLFFKIMIWYSSITSWR
jgi:hypothetical protein